MIPGFLEIDHKRGVIYFHVAEQGITLLRICRLGKIPSNTNFIDITHMVGVAFEHPEPADTYWNQPTDTTQNYTPKNEE